MDRKEYWNTEYVNYWKKRTAEADEKLVQGKSNLVKGDCKTSSNLVAYQLFDKMNYVPNEKVLDYGCGFGRFTKYFLNKSVDYYAIDISKAMIDEMLASFPELQNKVKVAEGESLHFEDNTFDKIICYGVFDACYQESALAEMLRVCNAGGSILITGKNNRYYADDKKAIIAEKNARAKGHPNYFTDIQNMEKQLKKYNIDIIFEGYVVRRGDIPITGAFTSIENFYEWSLIIRKNGFNSKYVFEKFSDKFSDTWNRMYE
jgi:ubiquinone/menaquinone biosynthesis C-methylase UbiE